MAAPVMPVAAVGPLPYDAQCPGAPRMYPIPLPQVPEYVNGLYTPPASPVPVPSPLRRASTQSHSSRREAEGPVPSLFPSADEDMYSYSSSTSSTYVPSYPSGASQGPRPTPNELWLMRQHSSGQSYMPAPSASVRISTSPAASRPALRRSNTTTSASAYDERRVRFAWGMGAGEGYEEDYGEEGYSYPSGQGSRYEYAPYQRQSHHQRQGSRGQQGQSEQGWEEGGVGAQVSKRAWGGRGAGDDGDEVQEEEMEEEELYPRARRRGR